MKCKGNQFKNKYVLIEAIHKAKSEEKRAKDLGTQVDAKKAKKKGEEKKEAKPAVPAAAPKAPAQAK